jgi:hypothetical protein
MSFLTPLYLAGLLAVSLPLVFHLIRRTPTGRLPFSSLMFLSPSPPRLTRKSRLDNLLLLLLRAAALILLGVAFARPFLRETSAQAVADLTSRRVALLIDTSASMRRAGVWPQVAEHVQAVLDDLGPGDDVALIRYDARPEFVVGFDELPGPNPGPKVAHVRKVFRSIAPGWHASNLDQALLAVADDLNRVGEASTTAAGTQRQIVLISDLQQGSRIEGLRGYQWPEDVQLTLHAVEPESPTNAGLQWAAVADQSDVPEEQDHVRVRVTNDSRSTDEQFQLRWESAAGTAADQEPLSVYVPAGESRVVRVPRPADSSSAERLVLSGDDHAFDNALYLVPLRQQEITLVYIGDDPANDPAGLRYYLERAFPETPQRSVQWVACGTDQPLPADALTSVPLVVAGASLPDSHVDRLRGFLAGGGVVLLVLVDEAAGAGLASLMDAPDLNVREAPDDDYAMLGQLDFRDPLFAPFADPRFNDFTKIHFWKHRRLDVPSLPEVTVLAEFDNGDPAVLEQRRGAGRLLVLTSGWHPRDSQLARSSKFVPLLAGVLERSDARTPVLPQYQVGQAVMLPEQNGAKADRAVRLPDGTQWKLAADQRAFTATDVPGIYTLVVDDPPLPFAVNVAAAESSTDPLPPDQLQEYGVQLGQRQTRVQIAETLRQLRDAELERQQQLWRWLILAAIAILMVETWLAGRLARRIQQPAGAVS